MNVNNYVLFLLFLSTIGQPALGQIVPDNNQEQQIKKLSDNNIPTMSLGGPSSAGEKLLQDELIRRQHLDLTVYDDLLNPWFNFKSHLSKKFGLNFGIDYTFLFQSASESLGEDKAAGGIFGFFGTWTLLGREKSYPGSIVFVVENRHRLGTPIAPQLLGPEVGYLGATGTLFVDVNWVLPTLYWEQLFNNGRRGLAVGRLDPGNFIDISGYADPFMNFQNSAILSNASIPVPNPGLGIVGISYLPDQWYLFLGLFDSNGNLNNVDITTFFKDVDYFKYAEIGWSFSPEEHLNKNIHLDIWHADESKKSDNGKSWGISASANWLFNDRWMPFFRIGWSDGEAPLMNKAVNIGMIYNLASYADQLGLGLSWGKPSIEKLRNQTTIELFYRLYLLQGLAITPSLQWIIDPSLNPDVDDLWILGFRVRFNM